MQRIGGVVLAALGLASHQAFAQARPASAPTQKPIPYREGFEQVVDGQAYTYIEQMPQLPGGGGSRAIIEAVQSQIHYPPDALRRHIEGRVVVQFVVGEDGAVRDGKILQSVDGGCDEEALAAVQRLPRFIPGKQQGHSVAVSFTVPVTFQIPRATTASPDTLSHVYSLVDQMPHLPNAESSLAIFQTIQRAVVLPAAVASDTLVHKIFVGFTVGPSGVIRDVKIVRGLNAACNAAALAAAHQLPRLVGGKLNGVPVSVSMTVPVLFGRLPSKP